MQPQSNSNSNSRKIKIVFLVNDLNFFCSHRLPIAEESKSRGFEVVIGYGELGGTEPKLLEDKGFKLRFVPMERGGKNLFKDLKTLSEKYTLFV